MKLKDWRRKSPFSARELAEQVGVAYSTWSCYENLSRRPRPEIAKRIEAATNGEVSASELLGLETQQPAKGLREAGQPFETAPVKVAVPGELADMARKYGLDVEALIAEGGVPCLREAFKSAYVERHKEAIEEINTSVRKHGTLSQRFRMI